MLAPRMLLTIDPFALFLILSLSHSLSLSLSLSLSFSLSHTHYFPPQHTCTRTETSANDTGRRPSASEPRSSSSSSTMATISLKGSKTWPSILQRIDAKGRTYSFVVPSITTTSPTPTTPALPPTPRPETGVAIHRYTLVVGKINFWSKF